MTTSPVKKADGLKALETDLEIIKTKITEYEGEFKVVMAPKLVTAIDEADLARRLESAEAENAEVGGDDDEDADYQLGMRFDPESEFKVRAAMQQNDEKDLEDDEED